MKKNIEFRHLIPVRIYDLLKKLKRRLGLHTDLSRRLGCLLKNLPDFSFIQVGANDGLSTDPYREFILESRGKGILVEPSPWQMVKLRRNYRGRQNLMFEEVAVSYESDSLILHVPLDSARSGVASLREEHARVHSGDDIRQVQVAGARLEELLAKYSMSRVDCLFLDVEGAEADILLNMNFDRLGAWLIAFENAHLGENKQKVTDTLVAHGYRVEVHGLDSIALSAAASVFGGVSIP